MQTREMQDRKHAGKVGFFPKVSRQDERTDDGHDAGYMVESGIGESMKVNVVVCILK